jgi:hypothetical protein
MMRDNTNQALTFLASWAKATEPAAAAPGQNNEDHPV